MTKCNIDDLTLGQIKELTAIATNVPVISKNPIIHSMLNKRCIIRTYSAGVHIGDVVYVSGEEVKLENALRVWKWMGALSLSVVANKGITGGVSTKQVRFT